MEHYYSLNRYLKETFGCKVYKLALDGGFTCPNRDGTKGTGGCIFCSDSGSGDFSVPVGGGMDTAIEKAKQVLARKHTEGRYIAYFQNHTNTYGPSEKLDRLFRSALRHPEIAALSVGTRPDCLPPEVLDLLEELNGIKPVFVELGLQTIHEDTARLINRCYSLKEYDDAVRRLQERRLNTVVHMILGLPGEDGDRMVRTAEYIGRSGVQGIKFQLLHVLDHTPLARMYREGAFEVLSLEEYTRILEECLMRIPPDMVVHRITGDGAKKDLLAPLWSGNKKAVLNHINSCLERDGIRQGARFIPE